MPTDLRARDALFEDILRGSAIGLPARKVRFGLVCSNPNAGQVHSKTDLNYPTNPAL
jgi:hypothetical protein